MLGTFIIIWFKCMFPHSPCSWDFSSKCIKQHCINIFILKKTRSQTSIHVVVKDQSFICVNSKKKNELKMSSFLQLSEETCLIHVIAGCCLCYDCETNTCWSLGCTDILKDKPCLKEQFSLSDAIDM